MSENFNAFQEKFNIEKNCIYKSEHWIWSVRPIQTTIGSGILSLKRPAEHLAEITEAEGKDFSKIVKVIESTLQASFGNEKINYIMLMMVDFHVHYHVIPRYSSEITFEGSTYKDMFWPKPPDISVGIEKIDLVAVRDFCKRKITLQ